jgi:hypothetical protein
MILHVFEETEKLDQDDHLEFWFGYPEFGPNYDEDDDFQMCFCGASLFPIARDEDGNITVATIWHKMVFDEIFFLEKDPFDE